MQPQDLMGQPFDLARSDLIPLFEQGEIEVEGRMPYSSNATLLVTVRKAKTNSITSPDDSAISDGSNDSLPEKAESKAIYKPRQGERPLHDFPSGLFKREVAMFRLAETLGWSVIPPTTLVNGPFGEGSIQAFVHADFEQHYFTLFEDSVALDDLRKLCLLDLIANNTDRKSGHCLLAEDGHVYGIDHGLAFHAQWKLRTVMWDFVGDPIPDELLTSVQSLVDDGLPDAFRQLLDPLENDAVLTRATAVVELGVFPEDETGGHRYPWPLV